MKYGENNRWIKGHIWQTNMPLFGKFLEVGFPVNSPSFFISATSQAHSPISYSDQSRQLVYEIVNSVDHELDVVLFGHAVLAMPPEDDIHIRAEDAFCNLHGDVPGDILIFEP